MMNDLLGDLLFDICFVYIDDIIVYGESDLEVIQNCRRVVERIFDDNLKFGGAQCEFLVSRVDVLGHVVEDGTLYPKVDKLQGLKDLRVPETVTDVKSVYGLVSFFRKFVKNFSKKASKITQLMKNGTGMCPVTWTDEQQ